MEQLPTSARGVKYACDPPPPEVLPGNCALPCACVGPKFIRKIGRKLNIHPLWCVSTRRFTRQGYLLCGFLPDVFTILKIKELLISNYVFTSGRKPYKRYPCLVKRLVETHQRGWIFSLRSIFLMKFGPTRAQGSTPAPPAAGAPCPEWRGLDRRSPAPVRQRSLSGRSANHKNEMGGAAAHARRRGIDIGTASAPPETATGTYSRSTCVCVCVCACVRVSAFFASLYGEVRAGGGRRGRGSALGCGCGCGCACGGGCGSGCGCASGCGRALAASAAASAVVALAAPLAVACLWPCLRLWLVAVAVAAPVAVSVVVVAVAVLAAVAVACSCGCVTGSCRPACGCDCHCALGVSLLRGQTGPGQTRPRQTRPGQTRPGRTRHTSESEPMAGATVVF